MTSRRAVLGAALALAAIVAAVVALTAKRSGSTRVSRGPIVAVYPVPGGVSRIVAIGQVSSISATPLFMRNRSDRPLVLDRIEGVRLQDGGPDILGAYVIAPPFGPHDQPANGYRVPATGRPLPGAVVGPHEKFELVFGVKAIRGRPSFESLDILYHSDTANYRKTVPLAVRICAPAPIKNCPVPPTPDEADG